jgi:hypothetical protein
MAWKLLAASIGLVVLCTAARAGQPAGPPAGYTIYPEHSVTSPDGATTIEQYAKTDADGDFTWQFWARRHDGDRDALTLLPPEQPDYPAGFRFTHDSRWAVRMQKTGSGEASLYLYRLGSDGFVAATAKPLGDLAWAFFKSRPDWRKIRKPDFHFMAGLVKGADDNYRALGEILGKSMQETWPDSRYLVIGLSGEVSPNKHHGQMAAVDAWYCRYDLQTGKFDVPAEFAVHNAKAIATPPL